MWENLKQGVKTMVDKKHELETHYREQRDKHIEELAMMVASRIQSDISKSLRIFDENYLRIFTCGSVNIDNTFEDVLFKKHLGMIEDRIRRNVPDWVDIMEVRPWDSHTNVKLAVSYIINEAKVCAE
jgi:hypothetical protein